MLPFIEFQCSLDAQILLLKSTHVINVQPGEFSQAENTCVNSIQIKKPNSISNPQAPPSSPYKLRVHLL